MHNTRRTAPLIDALWSSSSIDVVEKRADPQLLRELRSTRVASERHPRVTKTARC